MGYRASSLLRDAGEENGREKRASGSPPRENRQQGHDMTRCGCLALSHYPLKSPISQRKNSSSATAPIRAILTTLRDFPLRCRSTFRLSRYANLFSCCTSLSNNIIFSSLCTI